MNATLKLGKKQIARNLNVYRMAYPTQDFWTEWRENKMQLKSEGVSVFKKDDSFYVAIYDGTKATKEEYEKQEEAHFEYVKREIIGRIYGERDFDEDIEHELITNLEEAKDYGDLELAGINRNYIEDIESVYFDNLLRA